MIIFAYYSSTESYFHFVLFGRITFVLIWLCDGVRACVFLLSPSLLCTVAIRDCEWPIAGCECMLVCVCVCIAALGDRQAKPRTSIGIIHIVCYTRFCFSYSPLPYTLAITYCRCYCCCCCCWICSSAYVFGKIWYVRWCALVFLVVDVIVSIVFVFTLAHGQHGF